MCGETSAHFYGEELYYIYVTCIIYIIQKDRLRQVVRFVCMYAYSFQILQEIVLSLFCANTGIFIVDLESQFPQIRPMKMLFLKILEDLQESVCLVKLHVRLLSNLFIEHLRPTLLNLSSLAAVKMLRQQRLLLLFWCAYFCF